MSGPVDTVVNGHPLRASRIAALAKGEGISRESARRRLVEALLVAEEARRGGFPGADVALDPLPLAHRYLEKVFSQETLCASISPRQLRQFYEVSYRPEWPVDVYQGDLVELRCCSGPAGSCPAEDVRACLQRNRELPEALEKVAASWRNGALPPLDELVRQYPGLVSTDFGFVVWPDIPLEKQKPKSLFDPDMLSRIMALKPGEVSPPLRSETGYHLVRLGRFRPAITADSPEFVAAGTRALCLHRIEQTRKDFVARLLAQAVVEPPLKARTNP
ncbi:MAG: hypothetical protein FJ109_01960 [Deltaproteobacteria bacterium]|nr:hypothetical protein [Deltaproteobacteria bacterium]